MEEEKVILPKPPKALRQTKPVQQMQEQKKPAVQVQEKSQNEEKAEVQEAEAQPEKKKRERKKINFAPIINWLGLGVSVAVFCLFVFLLCK